MCAEIAVGASRCRVGLAAAASSTGRLYRGSGGDQDLAGPPAGRDGGVPPLAGGDDGMQVPQQRGGQGGVCLPGGELVVLAAGQVREPGGVDGVGFQRAPDRAPGGQAQRRASLPGGAGAAGVAAGALLPGCQAGVLDQRAAGGESGRVAGLGEDAGGADRGQAGDRGGQFGQAPGLLTWWLADGV